MSKKFQAFIDHKTGEEIPSKGLARWMGLLLFGLGWAVGYVLGQLSGGKPEPSDIST